MQIVERKPVPIYEVTCFECQSRIRYQASEVYYSHITCPVCRTLLWAMTLNPVTYEDVEPTEEEPTKVTSNYDLLRQKKGVEGLRGEPEE